MRNGSAGSCPPRFVAFSHLATITSARTLASPSGTTIQYRFVKWGNRRPPGVGSLNRSADLLRVEPSAQDEHELGDVFAGDLDALLALAAEAALLQDAD